MYKSIVLSAISLVIASIPMSPATAASAARYRTYDSKHKIQEILILLGAGVLDKAIDKDLPMAMSDDKLTLLLKRAENMDFEQWVEKLKEIQQTQVIAVADISIDKQKIELYIDGQRPSNPRDGARRAIARVIGFLKDTNRTGSVKLKYEIRYRDLLILRETFVEDGHLRYTTTVVGSLGPLTSATLISDAVESPDGKHTRIVNTVIACAPIGRCPCGPVTKVVERVMSDRIDEKLCELEIGAKRVAANGQSALAWLSDRFIEDMRDGLR